MKGVILDENLPGNLSLHTSLPIQHTSALGKSPSDSLIWQHAREHDLVIVTKDADFSDRMILSSPPPRVVHLRIGNMRIRDLREFVASAWPQVEALLHNHKLLNVDHDSIDVVE